MDFGAITLFLMFYYVRPQEWIPMVSSLRLVAFSMVFALVATLMRERGFTPRDLLRTPHDWLMLLYFLWIVGSSGSARETLGKVYAFALYYVVTVQALSPNIERIQKFLNWWTVMILMVAALAVGSEYGFDLMGSYDITHGSMKDRLVLNTSIFNNPNALGHSVVAVVVMLYFILWWKRPVFLKIASIPLLALPLYCIYLTQSKGSYLSAFAAIVTALAFNRPKVVQILILIGAMTVGWAGLHLLPRMNELDKSTRNDQAIQGRVAAFRFGLDVMRRETTGLGYGAFEPQFFKVHKYTKAPHSSYVQVGAELGKTGFTLFLGIMYCCLRTLITCKTSNTAQERVRRILFVLLTCYIVSSWMVGFAFRATFFLMAAAVGAFHRQLAGIVSEQRPVRELEPDTELVPALRFGPLQPAFATPAAAPIAASLISVGTPTEIKITTTAGDPPETPQIGIRWMRIGWVDIVLILIMSSVAERFWAYINHTM